jgi:hypothetical protein
VTLSLWYMPGCCWFHFSDLTFPWEVFEGMPAKRTVEGRDRVEDYLIRPLSDHRAYRKPSRQPSRTICMPYVDMHARQIVHCISPYFRWSSQVFLWSLDSRA